MRKLALLVILLCMAAWIGCSDDEDSNNNNVGGAPTITGVTPSSASIGQKNGEGVIQGTNLNGVTSVVLGAGVAVNSFSARSANEIAFNFTVAGNIGAGPISVTVTTAGGSVTSNSAFQVINNHAPVASFVMDPPSGSLNSIINFDASGTKDQENNGLTFNWDFGDGKSAKGMKVTHKYATVGDFQAMLRVGDSQGGYSISSRSIEILQNGPPVARLDIEPGLEGSTSTIFGFDGTRSSDPEGAKIKEYLFEFGDGGRVRNSSGLAEHQYEKEGNYTATLTVFDNKGTASVGAEKELKIVKGPKEELCTRGTGSHPLIFGRVVAVEPGNWAVTNFGANRTCANTYHKCDDYRRAEPENFYGIVDQMKDRGNGILAVHNKCPHRWPPRNRRKGLLDLQNLHAESLPVGKRKYRRHSAGQSSAGF